MLAGVLSSPCHKCSEFLFYNLVRFGLWCLTSSSTSFKLFRGCQFYWWRKPDYLDKTSELLQVTDKHDHIMCFEYTRIKLTTSVVLCTDFRGSYKSNYYTITPMTTLFLHFVVHIYGKCYNMFRSFLSFVHICL